MLYWEKQSSSSVHFMPYPKLYKMLHCVEINQKGNALLNVLFHTISPNWKPLRWMLCVCVGGKRGGQRTTERTALYFVTMHASEGVSADAQSVLLVNVTAREPCILSSNEREPHWRKRVGDILCTQPQVLCTMPQLLSPKKPPVGNNAGHLFPLSPAKCQTHSGVQSQVGDKGHRLLHSNRNFFLRLRKRENVCADMPRNSKKIG